MIESIVLKNTELNRTININKSSGEYWLNEVDFGQVEGTPQTFKFIDQIGESVYNTTLTPRQIQITGWVASWDEGTVKRLKQELNHFVNPKHLLELYTNGMKIQFYPRTSIRYSPSYQENNEVICKFLITGFCPYPLFTDENETVVSASYTEPLLLFPLVIPSEEGVKFGVRQPSLIAEILNEGDFPVGYTIEFRAHGTVVNPILTDIGTQQFIEISKTMESGEVITVDTREGYRQVRGSVNGVESNYFRYRNFDSSWLTLQQGVNSIRYNAESGLSSLEVYIRFSPAYLEVDV